MKLIKHFMPTKIIFGRKAIYKLKEELDHLGFNVSKVAVICGKSAVSNGYVSLIEDLIDVKPEVFDSVESDPTVELAEEIFKAVKEFAPELVIAIGGGSSIDVAKVVSCMLRNEGQIEEFIGVPECFKNPGVPLVAIPTTSGSGSEVTPYAVLTDRKNWRKAPLISRFMFPVLSVDDPELTVTMPQSVTANTGIDALTHAIEALVSKRATAISRLYSLESIKLLSRFLPRVFGNPKDIEAREKVMLGSLLGGLAITDAGAGLVHTMAHVLGVMYRLPHGLSNAMFLVPVLRFYGLAAESEIKEIGKAMGCSLKGIHEILDYLEEFLLFLGKPKTLQDVGFTDNDISSFISLVMERRHLMGNLPRIPTERDIRMILRGEL